MKEQLNQDKTKADWAQNGYASWAFNSTTCAFDPPTPRPDDGKFYRWDEATVSWVEITQP